MNNKLKAIQSINHYHGTEVSDPFSWLEDSSSEETKRWLEEQTERTKEYFSTLSDQQPIKDRLTKLWNYSRFSPPQKHGDYYYFTMNEGLKNQDILYRTKDLKTETFETVIDPNSFSKKGTIALTKLAFNADGSLLAYATSLNGSDSEEIRILDLHTGKEFYEVIKWCKFTCITWDETGKGFYYNRFPDPKTVNVEDQNNYNKLYWHQVGTEQSEDPLIFERPDVKELAFDSFLTEDRRYLIIKGWNGSGVKNRLYYKDLHNDSPIIKLLDDEDATYTFLSNKGTLFYIYTNENAPMGKVIAIDINEPSRNNWQEVIPEKRDVLQVARIINNQLVLCYLHHAYHQLELFDLDGSYIKNIPLPGMGSVIINDSINEVFGNVNSAELFISYTSFTEPNTVYHYDFTLEKLTKVFSQKSKNNVASPFETNQVFYTSKDGTKIPMFITANKHLNKETTHPVILTAYGGFSRCNSPFHSPFYQKWLEDGGMVVLANIRGGGEFGEEWHKAGMRENKQNVFNDFIAAAEWLIENKYTESSKLSMLGMSNGGLLVSACMVQRPELFGSVICQVPLTDMLKYHTFTVGRFWISEYGSAEENPEMFQSLLAYSPYHNVKTGVSYPPILITTADTDDRVVPAHAMKFAAALQASDSKNPVILRMEKDAGHGVGKPVKKQIDEFTDIYTFLSHLHLRN
ncbi:prolyl oligopeptidase family serine peptidase [Bacillus sp. 31A1R]|uniref:prolyl oligopeptidase n=1 Tax=Robertmurraya mangrovi TaxID=3098077 RepID=A0ABU5IYV3_9BACI|nr:prolyl oligopeptidase family serine peptidase [Bacillus sp. 31A1R]MDZ5472316.1 prolyl oligopeptidase family serine peptidase [Bacillus sp. 31A1R]